MSEQNTKKKKFPINAPTTSFAMKANLVQREPEFQKRWDKLRLYELLRAAPHPAGKFVFHDGPPYANGDIHLGHLLNKVLKDLVVRTKTMAGYDCPFIPGWDCHGLPIEHRVLKDMGDAASALDPMKIRYKCRDYAAKYVKLQAKQMQRLGTLADYEHPYITMDPCYEAAVLEVFADMVQRGLIYRALKPVHWSITNRTALADAELEYYNREDTSVYVMFPITGFAENARPGQAVSPLLGAHLMIWTTTPWTLPANLAVAVSPTADYGIYEVNGRKCVIAVALAERVLGQPQQPEAIFAGRDLIGVSYGHPFIRDNRVRFVTVANYVTLEDGTGLVHTAPGHGVEDYQTGLAHKLEIYCPVKEDGTFDDSAPQWLRGVDVWKANDLVVDKLRESGHLFSSHKFTHSYPHDWRSKTPVIFRATKQWFVSVDNVFLGEVPKGPVSVSDITTGSLGLRGKSIRAIESDINFVPDWGRNRMRGMLENMPDWCISRQRAWGLPIPVFFGPEKGQELKTAAAVRAVAKLIAKHGSDAWFKMSPTELLAEYDVNSDPDAPAWAKSAIGNRQSEMALTKSQDIFDVWFESGASWNPVIRGRNIGFPADLYLEGSDQHRGWFQKALLTSLGSQGQPSFRALLTHGFMVDAHGNKMSKSEGNTIEIEELMKQHGADVARWWVATLNYANDIKVDWEFFKNAGEQYRKVRNTIRYLLGSVGAKPTHSNGWVLSDADKHSIDAWARSQLAHLTTTVRADYENYNFRGASEAIFNFCNDTLSAVYLAASKDRMYCDAPDSPRRQRTQSVMRELADALIRLIAPILPHTADEAWLSLHDQPMTSDATVHTQLLPDAPSSGPDPAWSAVMSLRNRVLKSLEDARSQRGIDNPLDAGVIVTLPADQHHQLQPFAQELADLHGISRFELRTGPTESIEILDLRDQPRCDRSWKRDATVKPYTDSEGDTVNLSARDAKVLGLA